MVNLEHDAAKVASETHKTVFENDDVRVLEVTIDPGQKEPLHDHPYKSVTIISEPSTLKYFDKDGNEISETKLEGVSWIEPVGLHSTENVGSTRFRGYRIEMKK